MIETYDGAGMDPESSRHHEVDQKVLSSHDASCVPNLLHTFSTRLPGANITATSLRDLTATRHTTCCMVSRIHWDAAYATGPYASAAYGSFLADGVLSISRTVFGLSNQEA